MTTKWLNLFFKYSGRIFNLKQKIAQSDSWVRSLPYAFLLIGAELAFVIIALPLYFSVSPKQIQERGFVFPLADKNMPKDRIRVYIVRRKIGLAATLGAIGLFAMKAVFVGAVSFFLLGGQTLLAASQSWNFTNSADYTYDAAKIAVSGNSAHLVDLGTSGTCGGTASACNTFSSSPTCVAQGGCSWGGGASGATTNPSFDANSTGWTGADWLWTPTTETRITTGGNPNGYIQISIPKAKNIVGGGYWYQSFTTTASNPTATVSFDWKSTAHQAGATVTAYVFVDTGTGVPTVGSEVWSQTITGATAWASVANINVSSKVTATGTYYLKVAYHVNNGTGNTGPYTIGFDNVQLNWSKNASCSGTPTACNTYSASSACSAQGGCAWTPVAVYATSSPSIYPNTSLQPAKSAIWNSFSETATKNGGEIYYQLSSDDGASWDYWNGSAWSTATNTTHHNTATTVNSNIGSFSTSTNKIKWKAFLASNGSQQITLSQVNIGYTENSLPVITGVTPAQQTSSGQVNIVYNLVDAESDPLHLVTYEYSLTGAFAGEQVSMTAAVANPAHNGIVNLASSPSGLPHTFVWDATADVGNIYSTTTYVRLRANDGIGNSAYATSSAFTLDYVAPVVANVSAVQVASGSFVNISYDLFDNTATDMAMELQISDDGGASWSVPVTSASGDVNASTTVASGLRVVWNAGVDYAGHEKTNMQARVRARDKFQNWSAYATSANFSLDTKSPATLVAADLAAQPNAGESTVLVAGSFNESNPIANDFYVAVNTADYGAPTIGDAMTAAPSTQAVILASPLTGHDYIAKVKITEADGYGHSGDNENLNPSATYKFVKPYTPPAPTVDNVIAEGLDLTINKHPSEVDGLEYAIFESVLSKYVQADGGLGDNPVWQTLGTASGQWGYDTSSVAGKVQISGLPMPINQYSFHVKSRNTSDTSNNPSSESALSSGASANYNSPSIIINTVTPSVDGTKQVVIDYTGADSQNNANSLNVYEYSLDNSNWRTMTEKSGVGSNGTTGLHFTMSGSAFKFVWDAATDVPDTENSAVYVRLQSTDNITNSNLATSPAFELDIAGPVISNIIPAQVSSTNNISIPYTLTDISGSNNLVEMLISDDNGATWTVSAPSVTGDIGSGVNAGAGRNIMWQAGVDFANQEKTEMKVKIRAKDRLQNQGAYTESTIFSLDTKAPTVSGVAAAQISGSSELGVDYTLSENCYVVGFDISDDGGTTWVVASTTV
ncbi:MAG: hypothetical protein PHD72_04655, partial [Patescibacteria group bacterium]|nr:hypothetical protein [Patescibacteria group bacterium]